MKKWVCSVCGYVYEGEQPPVECPVCHVDGSKFIEQKAEKSWAAEHVVGVGKAFGADVPADVQKEIVDGLRANFEGECSEVGMYLAMARVAHREGYPEIGLYWEKAAYEEAEHAAKFAELLGEDLEPQIPGLCIVSDRYLVGGGLWGSVALIGPTRMPFQKLMPLLHLFADELGEGMSGKRKDTPQMAAPRRTVIYKEDLE